MLKLASKAESHVVLLIDANLQRHGSATDALAGDGYPSQVATSRNAALTVLGETPAAAVVLYPGRFDGTGFELIAALRRLRRTVPIAVVLGGSRSTASAVPRVLWFAVSSLDDRLRDALLRAIGVGATAGHRRDARETLPAAEPESAFEIAFGAGFEPDSEVTRPGVVRRGPSLRELEPFQVSALARSAR